jgi:transposase
MKAGSRKGRPNYDAEFKRALAAASCGEGVSVARLALEHGINANLLHKWRRQYCAGLAVPEELVQAQFLPVTITAAEQTSRPGNSLPPLRPLNASLGQQAEVADGAIEIKCRGATVRIEGSVDASALAIVLRHFHP